MNRFAALRSLARDMRRSGWEWRAAGKNDHTDGEIKAARPLASHVFHMACFRVPVGRGRVPLASISSMISTIFPALSIRYRSRSPGDERQRRAISVSGLAASAASVRGKPKSFINQVLRAAKRPATPPAIPRRQRRSGLGRSTFGRGRITFSRQPAVHSAAAASW